MALDSTAVVDALPYFDKGYDEPGTQESAAQLVQEEMKRYRPTKNYLEHLPTLSGPPQLKFETEIMKAEFDRLSNRLPMEMLSMKRYELPPPPAGKMTDIRAWQEAVENAQAQLEHQSTRIENLELMAEYGCNSWKQYNGILEKNLQLYERNLLDIRQDDSFLCLDYLRRIQELNWQRKKEQTEAGHKLKTLEETWVSLVGKNYEIEQAIIDLEQNIAQLSKGRTTANSDS